MVGEGDLGSLVVQGPPWGGAEARIRAPGLFLHVHGRGTPDFPRCAVAVRSPSGEPGAAGSAVVAAATQG